MVEVVDETGSAALLVGQWDRLMWESSSVHLLHGRGASVVAQGDALGDAAGRCAALRSAAPRCSGLMAPSGTRGMGNPAAVKRF